MVYYQEQLLKTQRQAAECLEALFGSLWLIGCGHAAVGKQKQNIEVYISFCPFLLAVAYLSSLDGVSAREGRPMRLLPTTFLLDHWAPPPACARKTLLCQYSSESKFALAVGFPAVVRSSVKKFLPNAFISKKVPPQCWRAWRGTADSSLLAGPR